MQSLGPVTKPASVPNEGASANAYSQQVYLSSVLGTAEDPQVKKLHVALATHRSWHFCEVTTFFTGEPIGVPLVISVSSWKQSARRFTQKMMKMKTENKQTR